MEYGVIDRTKIMVCCICRESIKPKYLGKDKDGEDYYWYEGENPEPIAPFKTKTIKEMLVVPTVIVKLSYQQG